MRKQEEDAENGGQAKAAKQQKSANMKCSEGFCHSASCKNDGMQAA